MEKSIFYTVTVNGKSVTVRIAESKKFLSLSHAEQTMYVLRKMGINTSRLKPKTPALAADKAA